MLVFFLLYMGTVVGKKIEAIEPFPLNVIIGIPVYWWAVQKFV